MSRLLTTLTTMLAEQAREQASSETSRGLTRASLLPVQKKSVCRRRSDPLRCVERRGQASVEEASRRFGQPIGQATTASNGGSRQRDVAPHTQTTSLSSSASSTNVFDAARFFPAFFLLLFRQRAAPRRSAPRLRPLRREAHCPHTANESRNNHGRVLSWTYAALIAASGHRLLS